MWLKLLKGIFITVSAAILTWYVSKETYHELKIPKGEPGETVSISISDKELEDRLSEVLKIPLSYFPREICYKNMNRVTANGIEIDQELYSRSGAGTTNIYVDYPGGHSEKLFTINRLGGACKSVDVPDLVGATIKANYALAFSIKFRPDTPSSGLIGQVSSDVDTTNSNFYVHLTPLGRILVLLFGLLGVGGFCVLVTSIIKFVLEEQFPTLSTKT